ncbi:hypothetical protein LP420_32785 [Massilia sp. B-10]|nr:hypothetical protein LP420_32785 [Massilia sp. B-10]
MIDLNTPGNDVRVVFNTTGTNGTAVMTAVGVSMNPDYKGFGNCPVGVNAFCVNDDLSVITLGADAPAGAKIYKMAANPVSSGTHITMAKLRHLGRRHQRLHGRSRIPRQAHGRKLHRHVRRRRRIRMGRQQ